MAIGFAKKYSKWLRYVRDNMIQWLILRAMRKMGSPNLAILTVNFIQSLDKVEIMRLIAVNAGAHKYVALLVAILVAM